MKTKAFSVCVCVCIHMSFTLALNNMVVVSIFNGSSLRDLAG